METNKETSMSINPLIGSWISSFNTHDIKTIISLYVADAELFDTGMPHPRYGRAEIASWFRWRFRSIPITYIPTDQTIAEDGQIIVSWLARGRGPRLLGARSFKVAGKSYFTLQYGLIQRQQGVYDHLSVLKQIIPLVAWLPVGVAHVIYALYLRIGGV